MTKGRHVRAFHYVNRSYEQVREALQSDATEILQSATKAAASRAHAIASALHVNIGGIEVGAEIAITVRKIEEEPDAPLGGPLTRLRLEWEAAKTPRLFPLMTGDLSAYALTGTETQLDFDGVYQPPLGILGTAMNAIVGRRIAEASVHRFVSDIATHLRETLSEPS